MPLRDLDILPDDRGGVGASRQTFRAVDTRTGKVYYVKVGTAEELALTQRLSSVRLPADSIIDLPCLAGSGTDLPKHLQEFMQGHATNGRGTIIVTESLPDFHKSAGLIDDTARQALTLSSTYPAL